MKILLWKTPSPDRLVKSLKESLPLADELHLVVDPAVTVEVAEVDDFGDEFEEYRENVVIHDGINMHVVQLEKGEPINEDDDYCVNCDEPIEDCDCG